VVINGAGASGISIGKHIARLGVRKENIIMCDTKGVLFKGRVEGMNEYKNEMTQDVPFRTLAEAVKGVDVLLGVSTKGAFTADMIRSMAKNPIIMAMSNPDPEITPEEVAKIRDDAVMATGRSDYPNQVNNVLCFPFIFRGALDVNSSTINEEMKMAASLALAKLTKEPVPQEIKDIYGGTDLKFGREYIIPKPFDSRVLTWVSSAVAQAAMDSGVAKKPITDMEAYKRSLLQRIERLKSKLV